MLKRISLLILLIVAVACTSKSPTAPVDTTCACTGERSRPLEEEK